MDFLTLAPYPILAVLASTFAVSGTRGLRHLYSRRRARKSGAGSVAVQAADAAAGRDETFAFMDTLYWHSPTGLAFIDSALRIRQVNQAFADLFGLDPLIARGYTVTELLGVCAGPITRAAIDVVSGKGMAEVVLELPTHEPGGKVRHLRGLCYQARATDGRIVGVSLALSDVTRARSAAVDARRLRELESLGRILGHMARETQADLASVRADSGRLLHLMRSDEPSYHYVVEAYRSVQHAGAIVERMLALTGDSVPPLAIRLDQALAAAEPLLRRTGGDTVEVQLRLAPDVQWVSVAPGQLERVLLELVIRAREAMSSGGLVSIETGVLHHAGGRLLERHELSLPPGEYAKITVSHIDHGPSGLGGGVFEERPGNEQVSTSLVGLSNRRGPSELAEFDRSGVCGWYDSTPGAGTTTTLLLPMDRTAQAAPVLASPSRP